MSMKKQIRSGVLKQQNPVQKAILSIAVPMAVVMAVNVIFSYLDLWYISRLGEHALHAVDLLFPYINLAGALVYAGLGTGISVSVARQGDGCRMASVIKAGLILSLLLSVLLFSGAVFGKEVLFRTLEPGDARAIAETYCFWYFLSFPLMACGSVIGAAMRGAGDAVWPAACSVACILLKAVLTPLFCFAMGMGICGAAAAAGVSFLLFFLLMAGGLARGSYGVSRGWLRVRSAWSDYADIFRSGLAVAQVPVLASVVLLVVLQVMGGRSAAMADAFSLAKRFELYLIQLTVCLGCGTMVVMGRGQAAGDCRRVWETLRLALKLLFGAGVPIMICMVVFCDWFYDSLTSSSMVLREGHKVFVWGGLHMLFTAGLILLNYGFQGIGRPGRALPFFLFSIGIV